MDGLTVQCALSGSMHVNTALDRKHRVVMLSWLYNSKSVREQSSSTGITVQYNKLTITENIIAAVRFSQWHNYGYWHPGAETMKCTLPEFTDSGLDRAQGG